MRKTLSLFLVIVMCLINGPIPLSASVAGSSIVGTVQDNDGNPVQGVKILVKHTRGKVVSQDTSDALGRYAIANLPLGEYALTLDPSKSALKGNTVLAALGPDGLTIHWVVSANAGAIAAGRPGVEFGFERGVAFGLSRMAGFFALVVGGFRSRIDTGVVGDSQ